MKAQISVPVFSQLQCLTSKDAYYLRDVNAFDGLDGVLE